jgi:transcription termination factor NusB
MNASNEIGADFFNEILEANKASVQATVRDALLDGVKRQFQWEIPEAVKKEVQSFITDEIIPSIRVELEANKEEFVEAATQMVRGVPVEIGKALQEHLAKNLTNSWTLRKITEACFS